MQGGADSRQEIHAVLSLEDLQTRHKRMLDGAATATPAERGDVEPADPPSADQGAPVGASTAAPDERASGEPARAAPTSAPSIRWADHLLAPDSMGVDSEVLSEPTTFGEVVDGTCAEEP